MIAAQPNSALFTIPRAALMNKKTLHALYADPHHPLFSQERNLRTLSATQLLTLHLAIFNGRKDERSCCVRFGPYIDSLPRSFDEHPLSWIQPGNKFQGLSTLVPKRVLSKLREVDNRYIHDATHTRRFKVRTNRVLLRQSFTVFIGSAQ